MGLTSQEETIGGPRGLRSRQKPLRLFVNLKLAPSICDCVGGRGLSANAVAADSRGRVCVDEVDIPPPQVGSHGFVTPATVVVGFVLCLLRPCASLAALMSGLAVRRNKAALRVATRTTPQNSSDV